MRWCGLITLSLVIGAFAPFAVISAAHGDDRPMALVIGEAAYNNAPPLPACLQSAEGFANRLRQNGYNVVEELDVSPSPLRSAIDAFAARPPDAAEPAAVFVCAYAAALGDRLFLLPIEVDASGGWDLQTDGILAKTIVRAIGNNPGLLFLELHIVAGGDLGPAVTAFRLNLAGQLHLGLAVTRSASATTLSRGLMDLAPDPLGDWNNWAVQLKAAAEQSTAGEVVQFVPAAQIQAAVPGAGVPTPPATAAGSLVTQDIQATHNVAMHTIAQQSAAQQPREEHKPNVTIAGIKARASDFRSKEAGKLMRTKAALAALGFYPGPIDQFYGASMQWAIRRYQMSLGDNATGILTPVETILLLNTR